MHQLSHNLNYLAASIGKLDRLWQNFLFEQCYSELVTIDKQLQQLSIIKIIYPPQTLIFNALAHTPLAAVRVVILGQDPYHGASEANGLAFAVNAGVKLPPSLKNIYKELSYEYALNTQNLTGDHLLNWANQGVLLLNTSLTVVKDQANSLANIGWQKITDRIIHVVSLNCPNVVFMLWGKHAQLKISLIDQSAHLVLMAPHPSPLSAHRGFLGCEHFALANQYLVKHAYPPIRWI